MQVKMTIDNLPEVKRELSDIQNKISDTAPLMKELANHLYNISRDSFDNERDPNGRKWDPLSASTLKQKSTKKMLFKEGDLQDKFIFHSTRSEVVVGTNSNYKGFHYPSVHQFGNKKETTPARAFMPITLDGKLYDGVEGELVEIVVDFVESAVV